MMPLLSVALYLAQFLSPVLMAVLTMLFAGVGRLAYLSAAVLSAIFILWSILLPDEDGQEGQA